MQGREKSILAGFLSVSLAWSAMAVTGCRLAMVRDRAVSRLAAYRADDDTLYSRALAWAEAAAPGKGGDVIYRDPETRRISLRGNAAIRSGPEKLDFDWVMDIEVLDSQVRMAVRELPYASSARLRDGTDAFFRDLFNDCDRALRATTR